MGESIVEGNYGVAFRPNLLDPSVFVKPVIRCNEFTALR